MSKHLEWAFEEMCPFCDMTQLYSFDDVDSKGYVECPHCGHKIHACSICDIAHGTANCGGCGLKSDGTCAEEKWSSEEMCKYKQVKLYHTLELDHTLELNTTKQKLFKKYLEHQADVIKSLYDDTVDTDTFEHMLWCNEAVVTKKAEPCIELNHTDDGDTWFMHKGRRFHIYQLAFAGGYSYPDIGIKKFVLAFENESGVYVLADSICDSFNVYADDAADNVAKWLLPCADEYIDRMNEEIH